MTEIAFISCAKTKVAHPSFAATLYTSPLFRKSLLAAICNTKSVFILSALHGLLNLNDVVSPYDFTVKDMNHDEKCDWADRVSRSIEKISKKRDQAIFYAGEAYLGPIRSRLTESGILIQRPLGDLSLGRRLQILKKVNEEEKLSQEVKRFYSILRRLYKGQAGGVLLSDASGRVRWPNRGVYLFVEDLPSGFAGVPRVTRVGTHAVSAGSRTTLWNRLSTHKGVGDGGGSHRSSIFRSHLGRALQNRDGQHGQIKTWGVGQNAAPDVRRAEVDLERIVSSTVGQMRVLWLDIADEPGPKSDRAFIERNAIGLLSRHYLLTGDRNSKWLGEFASDWRIVASGLWNLDHLFLVPHPAFLDVLDKYVDATLSNHTIQSTLAPSGWHPSTGALGAPAQLTLFSGDEDV